MKPAAPERAPAIAEARATAEELCRQLALERGGALVVPRRGDGPPAFSDELRRVFAGFEPRLCTFPELEGLLDAADHVLVHSGSGVLEVSLVRLVLDGAPLAAKLPFDKLAEMGTWFASGTAGVAPTPVSFHVYEVHSRPPDAAWVAASRDYRRRAWSRPAVNVGLVGLDASSGRVFGNHPGVFERLSHAHLLRRAFRERGMDEQRRRAILSRTGLRPLAALASVALGAALGIGGTELLLSQLVSSGNLYAGVVLLSSFLAAAVSVKSCRLCTRALAQSMVGGLGTLAALSAYRALRHLPFGAGSVALPVIVVGLCFLAARIGARQK